MRQIEDALNNQKLQKSALPQPSTPEATKPPSPADQKQSSAEKKQPPATEKKQPSPTERPSQPPETELSPIERLLSGQLSTDVSTNLRQFGYEVFNKSVSTFAPVTDVPVGPDYVIGPGDAFTLTMWGRVTAQNDLQVDRDGQIILPEVGALKIWGMKFGDLESYLQHELSRKYTDFKMSITMNRLRTIQVFVVGEVSTPGTYTVSSLSTVINALVAAGGPSKNGSLRKIRLIRAGQDPVEIDLYAFLLGGDRTKDLRLHDGDTIFIPLIGPIVGVAGSVKRPAIYEMAKPMTLREVLDLSGGITFAGWLQRVQVERIESHQRRIVVDFDLSTGDDRAGKRQPLDTVVREGDLVKVLPVVGTEQNVVLLEGHVIRPGKYEFRPGMKLSDILNYDVFLPQVNLEYAEIERLMPPDFHPVTIPFNLGKLLRGDPSANLELARFDRIHLFRWDQKGKRSVSISGLVYDPNEFRLVDGMRVKDLVEAAGGLKKDAQVDRAELTRRKMDPNGVYYSERQNVDLRKALAGDTRSNLLLEDRDRLVVLPKPEWRLNEQHVTISGLVYDPNEYRLFEGMRLKDLVNLAGGLQKNAYLRTAEITRRHISQEGMATEKIEVNLEKALAGDPENNIPLRDYDYLVIRPIPDVQLGLTAEITGEVRFPGTYPIQKQETLSSLIERAGGYTEQAYLRGAVFTRKSAMEIQRRRLDEMVSQIEQSMLGAAQNQMSGAIDPETAKTEQAALAAKKELLTKLRATEITGRVVIRLTSLEELRSSKYDFELENGDKLIVPQIPGVVHIVGEVFNATSLVYEHGETVNFYLRKVGGMTKDADKKQVSVVKADGSVISAAQGGRGRLIAWDSDSNQWTWGGFMNVRLEPGDTIVVPRKVDKSMWLRDAKDITQILANAAIAAGVPLAVLRK